MSIIMLVHHVWAAYIIAEYSSGQEYQEKPEIEGCSQNPGAAQVLVFLELKIDCCYAVPCG